MDYEKVNKLHEILVAIFSVLVLIQSGLCWDIIVCYCSSVSHDVMCVMAYMPTCLSLSCLANLCFKNPPLTFFPQYIHRHTRTHKCTRTVIIKFLVIS